MNFASAFVRRSQRLGKRRSQGTGRRGGMGRRLRTESLETRTLLAADVMHNVDLATDVDDSGQTTPMDALHVINELNTSGIRSLKTGTPPRILGLYYDVFKDDHITPMDALTVLNALQAEGEHDENIDVVIRLDVTNLDGESIDTIDAGSNFLLNVHVQDHTGRADSGGVFAAYLDVEFDSTLVSTIPQDNGANAPDIVLTNGPSYAGNRVQGDVSTPGLIDEVGTFAGSIAPLGSEEFLLLSFEMTADQAGEATFGANRADLEQGREVLLYGTFDTAVDGAVDPNRIEFIPDTLQINGDVDAPIADDDSYTVNVNETLIVGAEEGLLVGDTYDGPGALTAAIDTQPSSGSVTVSANGAFTYTPNADFVGDDTFTYVASADGLSSEPATVTISVIETNSAPVANDDTFAVDEDMSLSDTVLTNDTDADGDILTATLQQDVANGSLTLNGDGTFVYLPAANFNGTDTFSYVVSDGIDTSNTATVTITVNPLNDGPVASGDAYSVATDGTLTVAVAEGVLVNDSDIDGDILTAVVDTLPTNGSLNLESDGSFVYTPDAGFVGSDSFTYFANDGLLNSNAATVTIDVQEVSDDLVAFYLVTANTSGAEITSIGPGGEFLLQIYTEDIGGLREIINNDGETVSTNGVFAAYLDVFYDDSLVSITGEPMLGDNYPNQPSGDTTQTGVIDELGGFSNLTPLGQGRFLVATVPMMADAQGTAVFTSDDAEGVGNQVLLFGVDDPVEPEEVVYGMTSLEIVSGDSPTAEDDAFVTDEDVTLSVTAENGVLANDTDPDSTVLSVILVEGPENGTLDVRADGSFDYVPDANFNGVDTFTYRASDGVLQSNLATVTITVNPIADAGIANNDSYRLDSLGSLVVDAASGVLANDVDVDGDGLTAVLVTGPESGTLELNEDGSFTYTPADGFVGRDTFEYLVVTNEIESNVAVVDIEVGDVTPSSITGFVYNDTNNDGVMNPWELRYGNVHVRLRGVDLLGNQIAQDIVTSSDGSYRFDGLLQGDYTVTEFQPLHLVDGKDTIGTRQSLRNDRFEIDLAPGVVAGSYNFGELGLAPQFIDDTYYFSSRRPHGLLAMTDASGELDWYCLGDTWLGTSSVDVDLSADGRRATIELISSAGASDTEVVVLDVTPDARRLQGNPGDGSLVRLDNSPSSYGLNPVAVDQAFGS